LGGLALFRDTGFSDPPLPFGAALLIIRYQREDGWHGRAPIVRYMHCPSLNTLKKTYNL
jgi:hypothetical protein